MILTTQIETLETDTPSTKVTIAKDRVTIKYPKLLPAIIRERQYKIVLKAIKALQTPTMLTRRGQFTNTYELIMYIQTNKDNHIDPISLVYPYDERQPN